MAAASSGGGIVGGGWTSPSDWATAFQTVNGTAQNGTSTGSGTTANAQNTSWDLSSLDPTSRASLNQFISGLSTMLATPDTKYTKEAAIQDSQGMVKSIFDKYKLNALPAIFNAQNNSGGYNSTGAQQLADTAFGQAVSDSSGVVMNTIKNYATVHQGLLQNTMSQLVNALGIAKGSVQQGSEGQVTSGKTTSAATNNVVTPQQPSIWSSIGNLFGW